jgi:tripartite-type tricarboxylate transporter receptor subunit TctC
MKRRSFLGTAMTAFGAAALTSAQAQSWPERPITWVYPYAAGGGGDPIARVLAEGLTQRLGQTVIFENRTGAAGMIGTGSVARAAPDGYTFLFGVSGEIAINQWLYKKMPYDPQRDFAPVCLLMTLPLLLVANPGTHIRTVAELIARAKEPGHKLTFASAGSGSLQHLAAELLQSMAGIKMTHIPYRGIAAATNDLLAGTVDVGFVGLPTALPHVRSGALVAIGLSTLKHAAAAPELTSLASSPSLRGFDLTQWFGLLAPAGTPAPIIQKLHDTLAVVMDETQVKARLFAQGFEPALDSPAQFGQFIDSEREKFGRIVREAGVKIDS